MILRVYRARQLFVIYILYSYERIALFTVCCLECILFTIQFERTRLTYIHTEELELIKFLRM